MALRICAGILWLLLCMGIKAEDPTDAQFLEMEKCFTTNGLYIRGCDVDSIYHAMIVLNQKGKMDENNVRCTMYNMISTCYIRRITEKCGEENARLARLRLQKLPAVISKACQSAGSIFRTSEDGSQRETKEPPPTAVTSPSDS